MSSKGKRPDKTSKIVDEMIAQSYEQSLHKAIAGIGLAANCAVHMSVFTMAYTLPAEYSDAVLSVIRTKAKAEKWLPEEKDIDAYVDSLAVAAQATRTHMKEVPPDTEEGTDAN